MAKKDDLLGNGTLTVMARLSSVFATACLPVFGAALVWGWSQFWDAFQDLKKEVDTIKVSVVSLQTHSGDQDGRIEQLDRRVFK